MDLADDLKTLCLRVIEQTSTSKGRVRLMPFDRNAWLQCAYFSIQRTILGGLSRESYESMGASLFDAVYSLREQGQSAEEFDAWAIERIQRHSDEHHLTIGQSQGVLNLLLKYYYCYYHAEVDRQWNDEHRFIALRGPFLHIPLDNYVLVGLKASYASPDIHINRANTGATIRAGDALVSWSRLADGEIYMRLQRFAREMQDNHLRSFDSGIHFAMSQLSLAH